MKYLLDSNILRYYTAKHPTMTRNLARIQADQIGIPFVVVIEQLRGRFDAYLKAEPENLLREQARLLAAQQFLSLYQTVYVDEQAVAALNSLRQRVNTRKRYADVIIAAMALASDDIVVTRNVDDFRDLLPAIRIQNWVDQVY
ncbi:MAG: type II toxin-antitoxin system VapC family toxin [Acidobacteriota bacterium]